MQSVTEAGSTGLVLCPKTPRKRFVGPEGVAIAAAGIKAATAQESFGGVIGDEAARVGLGEGPRWFVTVSPGSVKVGSVDLARGQRRDERSIARRRQSVKEAVGRMTVDDDGGNLVDVLGELGFIDQGDDAKAPGRSISAWSAKSRANMVRRLCTLDYTGLVASGDLAMVTLTYPGDWESVAGSHAVVNKHVEAFKMRWARRWGTPLVGLWKREFQRRGAPHYHVLCVPPGGRSGAREFRFWLSVVWADIVAHPDPVERMNHERAGTGLDYNEGFKMTDPKRIAVYFTKHGLLGGKDYQNDPPALWVDGVGGVGRYWGVWGLESAEAPVMVTGTEALAVVRSLRRWHAASDPLRIAVVWRTNTKNGLLRKRKVRRRVRRLDGRAGFLSVNDGVATAFLVERIILGLRNDVVTV